MSQSADRKESRGLFRRSAWRPWLHALEVLLVFVVFALQAPRWVPDTNEPNYLAKAKHYWNPDWLPGDFFLDTADTHLAFYVAWGWLTRWLSLEQTAWVGRLLIWGLLAWGWVRLSRAVIPRAGMALASAALFVGLSDQIEMAGEWVIGGCEGKGFAYALVLFGLGSLVRGGWNGAWLFFGAAAAFHVLVGGWTCIVAGFAWLTVGRYERTLRSMLPGLIGGVILALPGLVPGFESSRGLPADQAARASAIQVFDRLSHHLYLPWFARPSVESHLLWAGLWAVLVLVAYTHLGRRTDGARFQPFSPDRLRGRSLGRRGWRLQALVAGALLVSLIGVLVTAYVWYTMRTGHRSAWGVNLLRFYWFRLGDVMLPIGVVMAFCRLASAWPVRGRSYAASAAVLILVGAAHLGFKLAAESRVPSAYREGPDDSYSDWRDICRWVAENTPADATFLTPRMTTTFRWYAERGDVANFKDMPQDAKSVLVWWDRIIDLHYDPETKDFRGSLSERSPAELLRMGKKYGATYLITEGDPEVNLPIAYRNGWFRVYRLSD